CSRRAARVGVVGSEPVRARLAADAQTLGGRTMSTTHGIHEVFLREAIALAEQAHARGDEPFGAVLVVSGEIVLTASNTVILENDPTRHAELNLVSQAS